MLLNMFYHYWYKLLGSCNKQLSCTDYTHNTREHSNNYNQNQSLIQSKNHKDVVILHEMENSYIQNHSDCHSSNCNHQLRSIDSGFALSCEGNCLHYLSCKHHNGHCFLSRLRESNKHHQVCL